MNIVSYNSKNAKANYSAISSLVENFEIIYLIEHWLRPNQQEVIGNLITDHRIIFESDMEPAGSKTTAGRPYGGRCWLIKNSVKVLAYESFNKIISLVKIAVDNKVLFLFGVWVPFDDGSADRLAAFQSTLVLVESYLMYEVIPGENYFAIVGDFNCDLNRKNRFDNIFRDFIIKNDLFDLISFYNEASYTYENGDYKSEIDHVVCGRNMLAKVVGAHVLDIDNNTSDHKPVCFETCFLSSSNIKTNNRDSALGNKRFHFFDWNNLVFRESYCGILSTRLEQFASSHGLNGEPKSDQIDAVCSGVFAVFLAFARGAEKEIVAYNRTVGIKRPRGRFGMTSEIRDCTQRIREFQIAYRDSKYTDDTAKLNLKFYKKCLRDMQKFYIEESN